MDHILADKLDGVERKPLKCGLGRTSDAFVRGGKLFETARNCLGYSREQAADHYGTSPSLLTRQVQNTDNQHLSFQRICEMPPAFQRELAAAWLSDLEHVHVKTVIEIEWHRKASGE